MMTVNHLICYHNLTEIFNILSNNASESLRESLTRSKKVSKMVTRHQTKGGLEVPENAFKYNGFTYFGAKLWNQLPTSLKESNGESFKKGVKKWLMTNVPLK